MRQAIVLRESCLCGKKKRASLGERDVEEYGGKAVGKKCKKLRQKTWKRARKATMDTPFPPEESGMLVRT